MLSRKDRAPSAAHETEEGPAKLLPAQPRYPQPRTLPPSMSDQTEKVPACLNSLVATI